MKVHKDHFGLDCFEQGIRRAEGIFQVAHEDPALQIDDRVGLSGGQLPLVDPMSWRARDIIGRAQHAAWAIMAVRGHGLHVFDNLAFVPDMVAGSEDVGALVEELLGDPRGHAKAAGRILRVDHHQVDLPLFDQGGEVFRYDTPSGVAKDITDKQNSQKCSFG